MTRVTLLAYDVQDVDLCWRMHDDALHVPDASEPGCSSSAQTHELGLPKRPPRVSSQQKGRVELVWRPLNHTSGRRIVAWGNVRATLTQFYIGLTWALGGSPAQLKQAYEQWYRDWNC